MSQKIFSSRTTPNAPSLWFPARPPRGYQALPSDGPEDYSEVELHPLKSASDIEAAPTTDSRRACPSRSATFRELAVFLGFLLGSTLVFTPCAWLTGVLLLGSQTSSDSPSDHPNSGPMGVLKVLAVGSLVVALGPCAIVLLIFLRHGLLSLNSETARRARERATIRGLALVVLVVFAICVAVGTGLTTHALMSTSM